VFPESFAHDPNILVIGRIVSMTPPPRAPGDRGDLDWVRRDTWVRLECREVFHGQPGIELDVFLHGIPAELAGTRRRAPFRPGDFDSLPRLATSRPSLIARVPDILAIEWILDANARLERQLALLDHRDRELVGYAVRAVIDRWQARVRDHGHADDLQVWLAMALLRAELRAEILEQLYWIRPGDMGAALAEALFALADDPDPEVARPARAVLTRTGWLA
jgi:hypothetical protein